MLRYSTNRTINARTVLALHTRTGKVARGRHKKNAHQGAAPSARAHTHARSAKNKTKVSPRACVRSALLTDACGELSRGGRHGKHNRSWHSTTTIHCLSYRQYDGTYLNDCLPVFAVVANARDDLQALLRVVISTVSGLARHVKKRNSNHSPSHSPKNKTKRTITKTRSKTQGTESENKASV